MALGADGSSGRGAAGRVGIAEGVLGEVHCVLGLLRFALVFAKSACEAASLSTDPNPAVTQKSVLGSDGSCE